MPTFLFKTVKSDSLEVDDPSYEMGGFRLGRNGWESYPATLAPKLYQCNRVNSYLFDIEKTNIEFIRFVANTVCQAELSILKNNQVLYVIIYQLNLGEKITSKTPMILLLPFSISYSKGDEEQTAYNMQGKFQKWHAFGRGIGTVLVPRHTLRGSGRYKAVCQFDSPRYFEQGYLEWRNTFSKIDNSQNNFVGLEVAFARQMGRALKHVYSGGIDKRNYLLNDVGRIVLHKRGGLYHGDFDSYKKSFSAIWPLFSKKRIDKHGVLVEGHKVIDNGFPHLVTEFKAQRRNAYSKEGNSEVFKKRLILLILQYNRYWYRFIGNLQAWGHNLNYDVNGFQHTEMIYIFAEKILRLISNYFPNQLVFDSSNASPYSAFDPIDQSECLKMGNRKAECAEVFDALVMHVDWMRRNWVEYKVKEPLEVVKYTIPDTPGPHYEGTAYYPGGGALPQKVYRKGASVTESWIRAQSNLSDSAFSNFVIGPQTGPDENGNWKCDFVRYSYSYTEIDTPGYEFSVPWGEYNQWLHQTSDIAADIELVYLSFQVNALQFMETICHFMTIIDSFPYDDKKRAKGKLPGELPLTLEQKRNRDRTYPRTKVPVRPTGEIGTLKDIPKPTVFLPDLKQYVIDDRAIVPRCGMDTRKRTDDEEEQERRESERQTDAADRKRFSDQQRANDQKKLKAADKPRFKWRNESDGVDQADLDRERDQMYDQIQDNLANVADAALNVSDAIDVFVTVSAPEATPLVVGERLIKREVRDFMREAVPRLAKEAGREHLEHLDEFSNQGRPVEIDPATYTFDASMLPPKIHYEPPKHGEIAEFTGGGGESRGYVEVKPTPTYPGPGHIRHENGRVARPESGYSIESLDSSEPSEGRSPTEAGLSEVGDLRNWKDDGGEQTEERPLDRYLCIRGRARIPR
jgi:hypothetical protein